ncbi:sn-1-specific diacylglycerol lipase ABHD11-like [Lycorma delicatula]|uniref:sn-1-specific diacylglycerol lipase ABHD11-like n=1 Tax=Lycorma delicatula TaxID=130591 RepID=UPI003F50FB12
MVNINYRTTRKKSSFQKENVKPIKMAFSVIGKDAKSVSKIDKYPIIIMHGLFGSKMNWSSLAKVFHTETNKKVYLVDARNHGDSPHVNEHTYFHLAEDINLFMSDNNIEKATLIGHSMGGRAVMLFSILYSEKVESLTVADISPVSSPNSMKQMNKLFFAVKDVKLDNKLTLSNGRNLAIAQLTESIKSKSLANFLSMNLAKTESGEFYWKVNVDAIIKIYDPHITIFPLQEGKYYGPTMFICGAESDFVNFDDIGKIKKLFPNADFVKIENAGHWLHAENPKKFSDITCKFIKSAIKS